jgi:hypothetical protein
VLLYDIIWLSAGDGNVIVGVGETYRPISVLRTLIGRWKEYAWTICRFWRWGKWNVKACCLLGGYLPIYHCVGLVLWGKWRVAVTSIWSLFQQCMLIYYAMIILHQSLFVIVCHSGHLMFLEIRWCQVKCPQGQPLYCSMSLFHYITTYPILCLYVIISDHFMCHFVIKKHH